MNNLPLQPLVWQDLDEDLMLAPVSISESPLHHYVVLKDGEGIKVRYSKKGADFDYATGFATIDEAKSWAWNHYNEKMQPYVKPDSITDISNWFKAAKPEPTIEDLCVQIGCCLEEVAELIESLGGVGLFAHDGITFLADKFKEKDESAISRIINLTYEQRIAITDACCDINVTSVGVMQLLGGVDVLGAQREVVRSNNSKMVDGKFEYDANGKISKPDSYSEPDLTPFISTMQNLHKGGDCE